MAEEASYVGVDVAKSTLDVAVTGSGEVRQFTNDDEGIGEAVGYIAGLKPATVILEATGSLEMPLAAALQAGCLPVVVINPRQGGVTSPAPLVPWPRPMSLTPGYWLSSVPG